MLQQINLQNCFSPRETVNERVAACSRDRSGAFSLIELMVTVAVVAVLAGLLLSATGHAKGKAKETQCANNLKQIYSGFLLYQADNDGRFPAGFYWRQQIWTHAEFVGGKDGWDTNVPPAKIRPLYPYLGASDAFGCPADVGIDFTNKNGFVIAPSVFAAVGSSYRYNLGRPQPGASQPIGGLGGKKMDWVKSPTGFMLMYEPPAFSGNPDNPNNKIVYWHRARKPGTATGLAAKDPDKERGPRVSPILYVDGHVKFLDFTHGYGGFGPHIELETAQ
jgi:prepilin-type N-terminal cleavage/methylation domain-containing protein